MYSQQNGENSDLVWARMKYCPFWPARVSVIIFTFRLMLIYYINKRKIEEKL